MDPNYYQKSQESMSEYFWEIQQQLRVFKEAIDDLSTFWQDDAFSFLQLHYFNPIDKCHQDIQAQLTLLQNCGKHCVREFHAIKNHLEQAAEDTLVAEEYEDDANNELKNFEDSQQRCIEEIETANTYEKQFHLLIKKSNSYVTPLPADNKQ